MQLQATYLPAPAQLPGALAQTYADAGRSGVGRDVSETGGRSLRPALERVVYGEVLAGDDPAHGHDPSRARGRSYLYEGHASRSPSQRAIETYLTTAEQGDSTRFAASTLIDLYA